MPNKNFTEKELIKCPTGVQGLDEITFGGLPQGRPTLVCGNAGCGKTLLSMEFLVNGITKYNEPGVFFSFEESAEDLITNFASLGLDLEQLGKEKKLFLDFIYIEKSEIEETGEYDLDGLFLRLDNAISTINAKRVVLDTLEALFSGFTNESILRAELRRLFRWLKTRGVTAIITGERGERMVTKFGLEEYVADCVIMLDNRTADQISTRRLRILKYRGSQHGSNEYPFIITEQGISILPITSLGLNYQVTEERISTGIKGLDKMFDELGYYKGSSILLSGTAGTGKTSIAASFVKSCCKSGQKCLYFAFEESPDQIIRNMQNIGIDLQPYVNKKGLIFSANRPTHFGVEMHLVHMNDQINHLNPDVIVVDSITNLINSGVLMDVKAMLTRLLDGMKLRNTTIFMTDLSSEKEVIQSEIGISSLTDTWIKVINEQSNSHLVRKINIIKSRGMKHSNEIKEFIITDNGVIIGN
jgi:circadian clock protein KaiC